MSCPNDTDGDGDCGRKYCPFCGRARSALGMFIAERRRQGALGYTPQHDVAPYHNNELARAAFCYVLAGMEAEEANGVALVARPPRSWPWAPEYWKPSPDPVRNYTKAGALLLAEIDRYLELERLDRVEEATTPQDEDVRPSDAEDDPR